MKVTPWLRTKATPRLEASIPNPICLFSCTVVVESGETSSDLVKSQIW
uniref:Uncharacterized protein n=1 Tax=Fagus sylvatica TaxID=28930 RepID=A0A2N9ECU8_FAGSY